MAILYKEITFTPAQKIIRKVIKDIVRESKKGGRIPLLIKGERTIKEMEDDKNVISDRRLNFLDSSIWIRYATEENLQEVKNEIRDYHNRGLYNLNKARESKELLERLVLESYLDPMGGHAKDVVPFLFHSESEMKEEADRIIPKIQNRKWRFLLVDDESYIYNTKLLEGESEKLKETRERQCSRCEIIKNILSNDCVFTCYYQSEKYKNKEKSEKETAKFDNELKNCPCKDTKGNGKIQIETVCVKTVEEAIAKLASPEEYDIVLMDYLLACNKDENGIEYREYSDQILSKVKNVFSSSKIEKEQIEWLNRYYRHGNKDGKDNQTNNVKVIESITEKEEKELKNIKGINGQFWFFFISAYNIAVHERLLNEKFLHNTDYWHIEEGASPITTPHLFRYLLFSLMERQIQAVTHHENRIEGVISLLDLLKQIYGDGNIDKKQERVQVRQKAIVHFNNVVRIRLIYDKIKYDVVWKGNKQKKESDIEKSPLAISLFSDIVYYDNAFWEHLMHLVYLTAYGTIRQWPEMWEEYIFIKPRLEQLESDTNVCGDIKKYITDLRKNC